ncbi:MAG TPA: hypothetical protein VIU38_04670 [Anaerolineales bacterium]
MKGKEFAALLIAVLLLPACSPANKKSSEPVGSAAARAWFDSPLPGSQASWPDPECPIVAHGASPEGIATFELSINTVVTEIPNPDSKNTLATLRQPCGLTSPGEYALKLRVQDDLGNWSNYAETSLAILENAGTAASTGRSGVGADGGVVVESLSADHIFAGASDCGPTEVKILAHVSAPQGIEVVVLFFRFEPGSGAAYENVVMKPVGGDLYEATLNMRSILRRSVPFDLAKLNYQIVVQQKDGDTSIRTPVLTDVEVEACGNAAIACSSYNNQPACEAHGCKWVMLPGILPVFKCGNQ